MRLKEELKVTISEFLLAILLLLTFWSEHCEGKINENRYSITTQEQVVISLQNQQVEAFLKAYDFKFDLIAKLTPLPVDTSNLDSNDAFRILNEKYKDGKILAPEFEEKSNDYFTQKYNSFFDTIATVSKNLMEIQNMTKQSQVYLNVINLIKYALIFGVLFIQIDLFKSIKKRVSN